MDVYIAEKTGLCFGVGRAVRTALDTAHRNRGSPILILGPLVHNLHVVERLHESGISSIGSIEDDIEDSFEGFVILPSHGVPKSVEERLAERRVKVIDATCPFVKKAQKQVEDYIKQGRTPVIVGDRGHQEVKGLLGYSDGRGKVVSCPEDVDRLEIDGPIGVVSQTTQSRDEFKRITDLLKDRFDDVDISDTICTATADRQMGVRKIVPLVDMMIIVGGKNSANTKRLADICRQMGRAAFHIESPEELDGIDFSDVEAVGVAAGASTPCWVIKEVLSKMSDMGAEIKNGQEVELNEIQVDEKAEVSGESAEEMPDGQENMSDVADRLIGDRSISEGEIVSGKVVQISSDGIMVDIGYKSEGVIHLDELSLKEFHDPSEVLSVGDEIKAVVLKVEDNEGAILLSKKRADLLTRWDEIEEAFKNKGIISAEAIEVVKGGVIVDIGVRGFVPASQIDLRPVADLSSVIGKRLRMRVLEVDRTRNNVVLSQRVLLEEEQAEAKEKVFSEIEEGSVIEGTVTRLVNFGAFVDIGRGVEGLLHISDMSWGRLRHPRDVLKEGEKVKVKVLAVDRERERISLGLKQTTEDPWSKVATKYPVGTTTKGTIMRLADFGAFVKLEDGIEGLVHISQLSDKHVSKPSEVVKVGQEVPVKVVSLKADERKIGLSIREAMPKREKERPAARNYESKPDNVDGPKLGDLFGDLFNNKE